MKTSTSHKGEGGIERKGIQRPKKRGRPEKGVICLYLCTIAHWSVGEGSCRDEAKGEGDAGDSPKW